MAPTRFTEMDTSDRNALLATAAASIRYGLEHHRPLPVEPTNYPVTLQQLGASFVTLKLNQQLRGCIGSLEAIRPLIIDVAANAYAAAFSDYRFTRLSAEEYSDLELSISLLSPPEPMQFSSEQELIGQLQPGVDGLILQSGELRGTFLPSVWESLPDPAQFLAHLKLKAGLAANYWSDALRVSRYHCEAFAKPVSEIDRD